MSDWQDVESRLDGLAAELEYAKDHPFKVVMDFDTRFRVWRDQVLKDRLSMLEKTRLINNAVRYYDLSVRDYARLYQRATKEFLLVADNRMTPAGVLGTAQHIYQNRKESLKVIFDNFTNELLNIELRG